MTDTREATRRLLLIVSWLMAIGILLFVSSLEVVGKTALDHRPWGLIAEAVALTFLLVALVMYCTAATCLVAPFYEEKGPISEVIIVKRSRRLLLFGTFLLFWALGALVPAALDFHPRAIIYSILCAIAPIVWLFLRKCIAKAPV
jgi:hypothetical protein